VIVVLQLGVTLVGDILTLRRGRWYKPSLRAAPWRGGLPIAMPFLTLLLLFIGIMLFISSIFMGVDRIVTGVSFLSAAVVLHGGQILINKVFADRYSQS